MQLLFVFFNEFYFRYCMYSLVCLSHHVLSAQDAGSFLSKSFGPVLVQVKRSYDRFMQIQLQSILDCRGNRKSKCGILPFVANFEVRFHSNYNLVAVEK